MNRTDDDICICDAYAPHKRPGKCAIHSGSGKKDVRVHGNQHGTTIILSGELLRKYQYLAYVMGESVEDLFTQAVMDKVDTVLSEEAERYHNNG